MTIRKNLLLIGLVASILPSSACLAADSKKPIQTPIPNDSRIRILPYDESDVYIIRTKYGYQTNIVFDPLEEIQTISVGDRSLWQITPAGNRLFIRPMTDNIRTNMTLITNKRSYEFDIRSVGEKDESNIYVARFAYPSKDSPAYRSIATENVPFAAPYEVKAKALVPPSISNNYNYTYSGSDALAPSKIYDDGKYTFLSYQSMDKQTQTPKVFIVGKDGKETAAATIVHGSDVTVKTVAGEMVLRSKGDEVRIYNEALNPQTTDATKLTDGDSHGR